MDGWMNRMVDSVRRRYDGKHGGDDDDVDIVCIFVVVVVDRGGDSPINAATKTTNVTVFWKI